MSHKRSIAIITGTRAEFGLLEPVIHAIQRNQALNTRLILTGVHLLATSNTADEVRSKFNIAHEFQMQLDNESGRLQDAHAFARGVAGFASAFESDLPDAVLVLGDRIEAFAAASAAAIAGIPLAHIHGGDRAEGVADESMRHAISKLANIHFPASTDSANRLIQLGEFEQTVHNVGSPAIDDIPSISPLSDAEFESLGSPNALVLHHPTGLTTEQELAWASALTKALAAPNTQPLILAPNKDPGSKTVTQALESAAREHRWTQRDHLPRPTFIALLKKLAQSNSVLIGNSSAGMIEASAIPIRVINLGPRQAGRQRWPGVTDIESLATPETLSETIANAITAAKTTPIPNTPSPFGDGSASSRIASILAKVDLKDPKLLRKRNAF